MDPTGFIQVLQLFYFFFVLFEITTCALDVSVRVGKQGPFTYGNFHKRINGSVLRKEGSLISALEVDNDIECASSCVMNTLCLSVNFGSEANSSGKVQCELMNHGASDYHKYLVKKEKFFFMRMETICSRKPCGDALCIPQLQNSELPYKCECPEQCTGDNKCYALGMEDGRILDSQITASSIYNSLYFSHYARLNNNAGCWLTYQRASEWLQVNLLNRTLINGVATQGRNSGNNWVTTYQLSYSDDGTEWTIYKEKGNVKDFRGNTDPSTVVKNLLTEPFMTKFVRLLPIYSHGWISVRMELYGCPA